jgi:hypothetical protein
MSAWLLRPASVEGVELVAPPNGGAADEVLALLADPGGGHG